MLIKHLNLFLSVLETGKSKIKVLVYSIRGEGLLLVQRELSSYLLSVSHMAERVRELSGIYFIGALTPFIRAPLS